MAYYFRVGQSRVPIRYGEGEVEAWVGPGEGGNWP